MEMKQNCKHLMQTVAGFVCLFSLLLLTACTGNGSPQAVNATPTVPVTPTTNPTPTSTPALAGLHTFIGVGYTIGYPTNWRVRTVLGDGKPYAFSTSFTDGITPFYGMFISHGPDDGKTAVQHLDSELTSTAAYHYKRGAITTVNLAGESWQQASWTGAEVGVGDLQGTTLTTKHNGQIFMIECEVDPGHFTFYDTKYFEPMLQSFKFIV